MFESDFISITIFSVIFFSLFILLFKKSPDFKLIMFLFIVYFILIFIPSINSYYTTKELVVDCYIFNEKCITTEERANVIINYKIDKFSENIKLESFINKKENKE